AFMKSNEGDAFYLALDRIKNELAEQKEAPFADVRYDSIFDEKVVSALGTKDVKAAIQEYINRYNKLIAESTYFKKGVFEYYNASQIAKTLAENGFFNAKHTLTLRATKNLEISTQAQLEKLIEEELDNISKDRELKQNFAAIKKLLEKNITLRDFHSYLCSHELLLPHLANIDLFKEQIWKSYFKANESHYEDLLAKYQQVKARRKEIEETAHREGTLWEAAIDLFNDRFFVPFTLEAKNKIAVALGNAAILDLSYTFKDGDDSVPVPRETLMKSLSQGEKKALYILNIIFEIEVRRKSMQETLFVVDDIADSFDYKNKYAIIQYLKDIADETNFRQIILTHNFDFFRTVNSRFVKYSHCLMASKNGNGISLEPAAGIKNPFVNDWKQNFFTDNRKRIASIPFIRNILEYTKGDKDPDYVKLTSLLHWKTDSSKITQADLDAIYNKCFGGSGASANQTKPVVDVISEEAAACLKARTGINFEHKIVLSVAIRLCAEKFMAGKIGDAGFLAGVEANQTQGLLTKFSELFRKEDDAIRTLQNVVLMTPENIHVNSFMYEPILDMSDDHLRKLYREVEALK
ncbi:MAG: phage infection protein, partial [Bacteroidota bacterium]